MREKAPESRCTGCLSVNKEKEAAHTDDALLGRLRTGKTQAHLLRENQRHLRRLHGGNIDCAARAPENACERHCNATGEKESNK